MHVHVHVIDTCNTSEKRTTSEKVAQKCPLFKYLTVHVTQSQYYSEIACSPPTNRASSDVQFREVNPGTASEHIS